jgi:glycine/D-amino acid oxidase-like deaminating enzyme
MPDSRYNVIIVGGGVVGLGVALEITLRCWRKRTALPATRAVTTVA